MKVYLAGKVEGRKWQVVKSLSNIEWLASDGSNHSEHLWGAGGFHPQVRIGDENLASVILEDVLGKIHHQADCLVAYMDTNDSYGSIVELTVAATIGKPCLIIVRMPHTEDDDDFLSTSWEEAEPMADAYWFVSCLPSVRAATVESEEEATDVIRGFLLQMQSSIPKTRGRG